MIKGTALVVTYNSGRCVEACLAALVSEPGWEVIVVDNASQDDTLSRASRFAQRARIVPNSVNAGFSGGVNKGVGLANSDVLILVNPDAVAAPQVLHERARLVDCDARVLSGNERVLYGQMAIEAPPDDRNAARQVELLKQEPETVTDHFASLFGEAPPAHRPT